MSNSTNHLFIFRPLRINSWFEKLVIGKPLAECDLSSLSKFQKLLLWKPYGQYYRANPRSPFYMAQLAKEQMKEKGISKVDAIVDPSQMESIKGELGEFIHQTMNHPRDMKNKSYEEAILFFPDSIGYGWRCWEKHIVNKNINTITVVNGRRRVFPFNKEFRQKLFWRRLVEKFWLVEIRLLLVLIPLSFLLLIYDCTIGWMFRHES